jgi:hypothetical protein
MGRTLHAIVCSLNMIVEYTNFHQLLVLVFKSVNNYHNSNCEGKGASAMSRAANTSQPCSGIVGYYSEAKGSQSASTLIF